MANPWFRLYAEFAHDPKVQMMPEHMQRRYVMLMCMRCNEFVDASGNGCSNALRDDEIAFHLRISDADLAETKALFVSKGFIDSEWNLLNWEKRQPKSDRDPTRGERQKRFRENHKNEVAKDSNALRDETVTPLDKNRTDIEIDKSISSTSALPKLPDCPHLEILDLFGQHLPTLTQPRPESWDGKRAENLRARWRWVLTKTRKNGERYAHDKEQGLDWFARFFAYVGESDFLMGRAGNFTATLDWLVNQTNFAKVLDGNYENRAEVAA